MLEELPLLPVWSSLNSGATECFLDTDQPVERSWSEWWMGCVRHGPCSEAYEYRWNKEDEAMAIMQTIDAVLETPEVEAPGVTTEDRPRVPRRLYIRVKDIEEHGAT